MIREARWFRFPVDGCVAGWSFVQRATCQCTVHSSADPGTEAVGKLSESFLDAASNVT